jgi:hypothetical protein
VQKVLQEFKEMQAVPISGIDTGTYKGKRPRGELLVLPKGNDGLKYSEIAGFEIFFDLSFASLRSIYRNMKRKNEKD